MIRLLIATGLASDRNALRAALDSAPGLAVAGEAGTGGELLAQLPGAAAAVVVLDLLLPGPDAFALLPALRQQYPLLRIMAYSDLTNEQYAARAFDLGAHGYLLKKTPGTELVHGVRTVAGGRSFLCTEMGLAVLRRLYTAPPTTTDCEAARSALGLSKREMEVLSLVADGHTTAEIAARLFTSRRTVETHRQNILDKTHTRNTASLITLAVRQGLLPE
jgi:DNA-binding NarL/FixJ family response regulator